APVPAFYPRVRSTSRLPAPHVEATRWEAAGGTRATRPGERRTDSGAHRAGGTYRGGGVCGGSRLPHIARLPAVGGTCHHRLVGLPLTGTVGGGGTEIAPSGRGATARHRADPSRRRQIDRCGGACPPRGFGRRRATDGRHGRRPARNHRCVRSGRTVAHSDRPDLREPDRWPRRGGTAVGHRRGACPASLPG